MSASIVKMIGVDAAPSIFVEKTSMKAFRYLSVTALLAISASALLPAQAADTPPTAQPTVNERLTNAREAIKAKEWRKALAELNIAARDEPRNADVHNLLGYSYRMQAQPNLPKSFEHYNRALQLDPNHQATHNYIGMAYLMDKKPEEAQKHLAQVQRICGNNTCPNYTSLAQAIEQYKQGGSATGVKSFY
jgi:Flp pilus assembly protein TadD